MRVVQLVCSYGYSGVERYLAALAKGLDRRGFESVVIGGEEQAMRDALTGSAVRFLPGHSVGQALRSLMSVGRSDLVNSHMTQADLVALSARLRTRARVVSTLHFAHPRGGRRGVRAALRLAERGLAGQVAISEFVRQTSGAPATVIMSGVPSRARVAVVREPVVLVAQRLEREKDSALALRAWQASAARREGWRLAVAGRGQQEGSLRRLALDLDIAESVDFLGFRSDIDDLFARAGILLATAPAEPLGLTVVEAMAAGQPVVAAAGGGHLETAGRVAGAALFRPGDAAAAAAQLDRLAGDPAERARYGDALRDYQQAHLDLERQVDQTADLYRRVLA